MLLLSHIFWVILTLADLAFCELHKLKAFQPGHPIHGANINASVRAFYTGHAAPAIYCPVVVGPSWPNNTVGGTIFAGTMGLWVCFPYQRPALSPYRVDIVWFAPYGLVLRTNIVYWQVMVPGGQQTYIGAAGAIGLTHAHSTSIPTGSYREQWLDYISQGSDHPTTRLINWKSPVNSQGEHPC